MTTHSSNLAWRPPWTEEAGGLQSIGLQRVDTTEVTQHSTHKEYSTLCVCQCLLNPKDLLGIRDIFLCLFQKREPDSMHFSKVAMAVGFNSHSLEKVNVNMQHRKLRLENPAVVLNHFRKKSGAFPGAFPPYKIEGRWKFSSHFFAPRSFSMMNEGLGFDQIS